MNYVFREYLTALIFYIIAGGLFVWFNPFDFPYTGPFWLDWLSVVLGASLWFVVWVFVRAAYLSYKKRKNT